MDWSVLVELAGPKTAPAPSSDDVDALIDALADASPALTVGTRTWSARIAVEDAPDATAATAAGVARVVEAARGVGLPDWPVVRVEACEWQTFEAELTQPNAPELVGVHEIANLIGDITGEPVSRQAASVLARSPGFPKPLTELAAGPVWLAPAVRAFLEGWAKTKRPRPPRAKRSRGHERRGPDPDPAAGGPRSAKAVAAQAIRGRWPARTADPVGA